MPPRLARTDDYTPDPIDIAVGANLKLLRTMRGRSQEWLAEACGVTFQQIQKYETGFNRVSASRLVKIADALMYPISDFFEEVGSGKVTPTATGARTLMVKWAKLTTAQREAVRGMVDSFVGEEV